MCVNDANDKTNTKVAPDVSKTMTREEVEEEQCVIFEGKAYYVKDYAAQHPGGDKILRSQIGQDITDDFYATGHSSQALKTLEKLLVANVILTDEEEAMVASSKAKRKQLWTRSLQLMTKQKLNNANCWELTFAWQEDDDDDDDNEREDVKLLPGGHIKLHVQQQGEEVGCSRSYTPIAFDPVARRLTLAIKLYDTGEMSQLLQKELINNNNNDVDGETKKLSFEMSGPFGDIAYEPDQIVVHGNEYSSSDGLVLIAGGTGITPFLSVLRDESKPLTTSVTVVYLAKSADEVLYETELQELCDKAHGKLIVMAPPTSRETIVEEVVQHLPSPTQRVTCVLCGPPGMEETLKQGLTKQGYGNILLSTQTALQPSVAPKTTQHWLFQQVPKLNWLLLVSAAILPLLAIAINFGVPSSWPHQEAFSSGALGFAGSRQFQIVGFGEVDENGEKVSRYAYRLLNPTAIQYASPWVGYAIHQTLTLFVLYRAFQQQPKYSTKFRDFNWHMLYVQLFGVLLKYVQQILFYNGLSETLPLGFGTGTVFLFLVVVMIMYIPVRGLFFGYGQHWKWTQECATFFRLYHGFFIGIFIVNDFWYHPFESTIGHLAGIFNDALLLGQMVLMYTPFHLNKYWCLLMETFVIFHAALIALNRDTPGAVGAFGFAFWFVFIVTQMHGMGWSKLFRWFLGLMFVTTILLVYGLRVQGEEYGFKAMVMEVFLRIPVLEYLTIFFILGYYILVKKLTACLKPPSVQRGMIITLILIGTAICFLPLLAIFMI